MSERTLREMLERWLGTNPATNEVRHSLIDAVRRAAEVARGKPNPAKAILDDAGLEDVFERDAGLGSK